MLLWFSIGILFLSFDLRIRDTRERITEVMDSRPVSDIEMVFGRLLGIVLFLTIPATFIVVVMFGYGLLAELLNLGIGTAIEPVSVLSFVV